MNIALVGGSPLVFFLARELERSLARHAHITVTYFSPAKLAYLASYSFGRPARHLETSRKFSYVNVETDEVKSISLKSRSITTKGGSERFDLIFIDQTPSYLSTDLDQISRALGRLIGKVRSKDGTTAAVRFEGEGAAVWQLALTAVEHLRHQAISSIQVELTQPKDKTVARFLQSNGIICTPVKRRPGFTIASPRPTVEGRQIKGLVLDDMGRAITDAHGLSKGYDYVLVRDGRQTTRCNVWRSEAAEARRYAEQLRGLVEKSGKLSSLKAETPSLLLKGPSGLLSQTGTKTSYSLTARTIEALDRALWRRLLA